MSLHAVLPRLRFGLRLLSGPAWLVVWAGSVVAGDARPSSDYRAMIRADWAAQERRAGRQPGSDPAIEAALRRTARLLESLQRVPNPPELQAAQSRLARLRATWRSRRPAEPADRLALYHRVRALARDTALKNPLLAGRPIAFLQRRRFICQMLHEYIGYYYNYADLAGGGVYVLEQPGRSPHTRAVTAGRLPDGAYATLAASHDGQTLYFAFAEVRDMPRDHATGTDWSILPPAGQVPAELNYFTSGRSAFHLFAIGTDGAGLRQLTSGSEDDFDPCPLPDGRLVFMSSRRGGFCRCDNPFEPVPTHTLHCRDPATGRIETLSRHETNEWHPSLLNDGRIIYCRWDYVDRSAAHFHGLWVCHPDGSDPRILFGNYTKQISACFQPRAIPGSRRIAFLAGAHHANVGGSLVLLDPARIALDPVTGADRFEALERLTPEVCFPETAEGWPDSFFHSPWPLSEDHYLVAFSFDPLPGMSGKTRRDSETGIYYFDRFGNLELLFRRAGRCCVNPVLLGPRAAPPRIARRTQPALAEEGEFLLFDVNWSLLPLPPDRPIRQLRIFQVLPKETTHVANLPRIGMANAEPARLLLGTVPVETDGSAYFRAPAGKPLYFQAVDGQGRAVQTMRSVTYLQPGEQRGCVGCHEPPQTVPYNRSLQALRRPPSPIRPGPPGTRPLSYPLLMQGVLDRHCLPCHDGNPATQQGAVVLTGDVTGTFTRSYENLRPFVRWYEWGDQTIGETVSRPGQCGADASRLTSILEDRHHAHLELPDADRRRIYLWLDANVPFYGTYLPAAQDHQRGGRHVPVPELQ